MRAAARRGASNPISNSDGRFKRHGTPSRDEGPSQFLTPLPSTPPPSPSPDPSGYRDCPSPAPLPPPSVPKTFLDPLTDLSDLDGAREDALARKRKPKSKAGGTKTRKGKGKEKAVISSSGDEGEGSGDESDNVKPRNQPKSKVANRRRKKKH